MNPEHKKILLKTARDSIQHGIHENKPIAVNPDEFPEELQQIKSTFITLYQSEELRGCIGSLDACHSLIEDVAKNAYQAAFRDPRFPPVTQDEFPKIHISISILSNPEKILFANEEDLLSKIRPGIDGLILKDGPHQGTFLPTVWESLPKPMDFLQHLKRKAGLSKDYWSKTIQIERYTSDKVEE